MPYADLLSVDERIHVERVPFNKVEFGTQDTEDGERLFAKFGDSSIRVRHNPRSFETLCQGFGVPYKFADSVSQTLLSSIFQEMAVRQGDTDYNWAVDPNEGELVAFGDAKKPYIPFRRVAQVFENQGFTINEDKSGFVRHGQGEVIALHETQARVSPRVGDDVLSGINLRMNPMMDDPPVIVPWSERLVCSNGMTTYRERERIGVVGHTVDDVLEQIESEARRAFERAEMLNHGFADMVGQNVLDPEQAMRNILRSHDIPARMRENLLAQARTLAPEYHTMYDVLNIFTRAATGIYNSDNRIRLQAVGGNIALDNHLSCSQCGHDLD